MPLPPPVPPQVFFIRDGMKFPDMVRQAPAGEASGEGGRALPGARPRAPHWGCTTAAALLHE